MHLRRSFILGIALCALFSSFAVLPGCAGKPALPSGLSLPPDRLDALQLLFQDPPAEYRSAPLWVWNDRVTAAQIDEQLADFKSKGLGGVFVHPRPGLITPYLSAEWLDLFRHAVEKGKSLGLKVWIYDENSYPSGFAGGHVPEAMPDAVRAGLFLTRRPEIAYPVDPMPLVALRRTDKGFEDITSRLGKEPFGPGDYYFFGLYHQKPNPWYGGFAYVDIMRPEVTAKFLEVTLDAYKKAFGAEFGGVVPGTFQDEAEINPASAQGMVAINWTPRLFEAFQKKWGYDLKPHLPSLFEETGEWRRVRHDYRAVLLDLFVEGWAKPYFEYCRKNNLALTGHYWEHEWPRPVVNPDSMAFAAYSHMPGVDILMNVFERDTHAQFGNARAVKEIRSVANQLGLPRTMSETYGAGGWDLTFFDQKRIADWEYALGVNFMNQHLSYVTIMGARKRDHPQSFSYHEPWWADYKIMGDYIGRLSAALTSGRQDNRILVLEPTTTAWMAFAPGQNQEKLDAIGKGFQAYIDDLEGAQIDYDLASEDILRNHGRVEGSALRVGQQHYDLVVLPAALENLESSTLKLLDKFLKKGGEVLCLGPAPKYVDGRESARPAETAAANAGGWITAEGDGMAKLLEHCPPTVDVTIGGAPARMPNMLFHHRRTFADGQLLFLANVDSAAAISGEFTGPGQSCERWDLFTGRVEAFPSRLDGSKLRASFEIPPGGSLLLCLKPGAGFAVSPSPAGEAVAVEAEGTTRVVRAAPNVLTLDYCDLNVHGETFKDIYFYEAQLLTFRAHGLGQNPWDSAVQFRTNILDKDKFPPDSGFEAAYKFRVDPRTSKIPLQVVVERPGFFRVLINGHKLEAIPGGWWLDKAFGLYDLGPYVVAGENTLTVKAMPFSIHSELEPVYLLGDFGLKAEGQEFVVVTAKSLGLGPWSGQGCPFYGGRVTYAKTIDVPAGEPVAGQTLVKLGRWLGSEADVRVNGEAAGTITFAPFELDISSRLKPGKNEVVVSVCGTLKNTLGPFHNDPPLGQAWPGSFQYGAKGGRPAASAYSVVGYGLFEDFKILVRKGP